MRNDRHHQIGAVDAPEVAQFAHHEGVEQADNPVHGWQYPGRSLGPTAPQAPIVNILRIDAGGLPYKIEMTQDLLQVDQLNLPGPFFNADGLSKRHRSAAVSATRVKEDHLYGRHFETEYTRIVNRSLRIGFAADNSADVARGLRPGVDLLADFNLQLFRIVAKLSARCLSELLNHVFVHKGLQRCKHFKPKRIGQPIGDADQVNHPKWSW